MITYTWAMRKHRTSGAVYTETGTHGSNREVLRIIPDIDSNNYSPVRSGRIGDFFYVLATGQWKKIDWSNLLLALTTLFGVEVAVMLLLWVGKLAFTMKRAVDKQ